MMKEVDPMVIISLLIIPREMGKRISDVLQGDRRYAEDEGFDLRRHVHASFFPRLHVGFGVAQVVEEASITAAGSTYCRRCGGEAGRYGRESRAMRKHRGGREGEGQGQGKLLAERQRRSRAANSSSSQKTQVVKKKKMKKEKTKKEKDDVDDE